MVREDFGLHFGVCRELLLQGASNTGMQLATLAAKQRAVCRVLHQCVLEEEIGLRWFTARKNQPGPDQPVQRQSQFALAPARDGGEQHRRTLGR
jgi:hypothetical protein